MLIVLSGLPGTGKSAIATRIAEVRGLPVLSVDPIESAIVRAGIAQSFETGLAAYVVAEALAESMLMTGLSPVIDAVNSVDEARDMWRGLAAKRGVTLRIIECSIADDDAHRARLHARERGLAIPEPAWDEVVRRRQAWLSWPEPHVTIDGLADLEANVAAVLAFLERPVSAPAGP